MKTIRFTAVVSMLLLAFAFMTGCGGEKKPKKPSKKTRTEIKKYMLENRQLQNESLAYQIAQAEEELEKTMDKVKNGNQLAIEVADLEEQVKDLAKHGIDLRKYEMKAKKELLLKGKAEGQDTSPEEHLKRLKEENAKLKTGEWKKTDDPAEKEKRKKKLAELKKDTDTFNNRVPEITELEDKKKVYMVLIKLGNEELAKREKEKKKE